MYEFQEWAKRPRLLITSTLLASAVALPLPAAAQSQRPVLAADQCQPLSMSNLELCCVAENRMVLLSPEQLNQCPPLTTSGLERALESVRERDETVTGSIPDDADEDVINTGRRPDAGSNPGKTGAAGNPGRGNPGNGQAVGNAGNQPGKGGGQQASADVGKGNNGFGNGGRDGSPNGMQDKTR